MGNVALAVGAELQLALGLRDVTLPEITSRSAAIAATGGGAHAVARIFV